MKNKINTLCLGVTLTLPLHAAVINGDSNDNTLIGTNNSDFISADSGNDMIIPNKGNDYVNGMDGEDYVVYNGHSTKYTLTENSGATLITYTDVSGVYASGMSGFETYTDTLENVEFIRFTDKIIELNSLKKEIIGTDDNDHLLGTDKDDTIIPNKGNDYVNGMEGEDYVVYNGHSTKYTLTENSGATLITYADVSGVHASGISGFETYTDTLENVEFVKFDDKIEQLNKVKEEILDFDKDGIIDSEDTDDDNDGIPDSVELENDLDPLNSLDALEDSDSDGVSNLEEYKYSTNINDANSTVATLNIKRGWQLVSLEGMNTNVSLDIFKNTDVRKIRTVQDSKWHYWFINGTKKENKITLLDSNKSYFLKSKSNLEIKYPIEKVSENTNTMEFNKKSWYMINKNSLTTLLNNQEEVKLFKFKKVRKTAKSKVIKRRVLKRINTENLEIIDAGGYIIKLK